MEARTTEQRLQILEADVKQLKEASDKIANLMATLGGKFEHPGEGILTDDLAQFFIEVGRTLKSIRK